MDQVAVKSRHFNIPPSDLELLANEVHIWIASLTQSRNKTNYFPQDLSNSERSRAKRFYFDYDRDRYITAHGILRDILGRYLNTRPGKLKFSYGKYGKPAISNNHVKDKIRFNLSYSESVALYAFTLSHEIGVDVEVMRDIPEKDQIASRSFSPKEYDIYSSLPERKKKDVFYKYWTRKEAFCKATGEGLCLPLADFDVSNDPAESVLPLTGKDDRYCSAHWIIYNLNVETGYKAALAVEKGCKKITRFKFSISS